MEIELKEVFGVVVIGRNEEKNLPDCFASLAKYGLPIVYVDSSSKDNSVEIARSRGIEVAEVEYVSAGYARNIGADRLLKMAPRVCFIQFVDGDTTISEGWFEEALKLFLENQDAAVAAGELIEKDGEESIYKLFSKLEWENLSQEAHSTGGNFAVRADVFIASGGFNPSIVGGEDTELCARIKNLGWTVSVIPVRMGEHDSKVLNIRQFWIRSQRAGEGYQEISRLYIRHEDKLFLRQNISNWVYGGIIPLTILMLLLMGKTWALWLLLVYPILVLRIYLSVRRKWKASWSLKYAILCVLGKFPGFVGAVKRCCRIALMATTERSQ